MPEAARADADAVDAIESLASLLRSREELFRHGMTRTSLERALREGVLVRVHRGVFAPADAWGKLWPEERDGLRVMAVEAATRGAGTVYSHTSAASIGWGLPFARFSPRHVHTVSEHANGRVSDGLVARHRAALPDGDVVWRNGVLVTSLERTVSDLIGVLPVEAGVALADAAMRRVAWDDGERRYDEVAAEQWREGIEQRLADRAGGRGIRLARWVIRFADGRAQRPGESISRLYLHELGFRSPRLQVVVIGPHGQEWALDLGLDDIPAWAEFDGERKYTDPQMLAGRTAAEAVLAEKWREDWIRGATGRSVLRWGDIHIRSAATLAERLREFHVALPHPRARFHTSARRSTL